MPLRPTSTHSTPHNCTPPTTMTDPKPRATPGGDRLWYRAVAVCAGVFLWWKTLYRVEPMYTGTVISGNDVSSGLLTGTGFTAAGGLNRQLVKTASGPIRIVVDEVTCPTSGAQWEHSGAVVQARVVDPRKLVARGGAAAVSSDTGTTTKYVRTVVVDGVQRHLQDKCSLLAPEEPIRANLQQWSKELTEYLNKALDGYGIVVSSATMGTKFTGKYHSIDENENVRVAAPSRAIAAVANQQADQAEADRALLQVNNALLLNRTKVEGRINTTRLEAAAAARILADERDATVAHLTKMRAALGDELFATWLYTTAIKEAAGTVWITDAAHPPTVTAAPGHRS